ncbi:MAG: DUF3000 domain-containing protein [Actinomycetaceae bacterium]|nr:DUF3000 domain-containing protein [Arcanobacterium sp.]MDD7505861.1 DUF3000 domain-containing protein [Actinomycetaceae bacterium]MDY6142986.1 DUF3000 domain-containing protein [Arcanobacterium sp.]
MIDQAHPPAEFITALGSLKGQSFRPEFHVSQIPPPQRIAPWSVALQAEVNDTEDLDPDSYRGDMKFVVLHDPDGQLAWDGTFRIIVHARAPMDGEMGDDPLLGEVAWSWLADALESAGAGYHDLSGTVTRVFNETFGGLYLDSSKVDLELRASWTPQTPYLTEHLLAWADFSATFAGLAPYSPGLAVLPRKVAKI